jgi:cytochrome c biogenesis protein CcmG, thiol:disulfide interchange protein DsbE
VRSWIAASLVVALLMFGPPLATAQDAGLAVGTRAPAVVVKDLDGRPVDLGALIGTRPFLLEFWATWCEVCAALMPTVRAAHDQFGDRVEFFGVNVTVNQTPERVRKYLAANHPPFRTLYDSEGASTRAYQAPTTSYIVIVDRHGKVAYTGTGASQDLASALRSVTSP